MRCGLILVMKKMPCVPQNNIGAVDRLPVDVFAELNLGICRATANYGDAIVQFIAVVSQTPDVSHAVGVGGAIGESGYNLVAAMSIAVYHSPTSREWGAFSLRFANNWPPARADRKEQA
jgi:hypothetical protein